MGIPEFHAELISIEKEQEQIQKEQKLRQLNKEIALKNTEITKANGTIALLKFFKETITSINSGKSIKPQLIQLCFIFKEYKGFNLMEIEMESDFTTQIKDTLKYLDDLRDEKEQLDTKTIETRYNIHDIIRTANYENETGEDKLPPQEKDFKEKVKEMIKQKEQIKTLKKIIKR